MFDPQIAILFLGVICLRFMCLKSPTCLILNAGVIVFNRTKYKIGLFHSQTVDGLIKQKVQNEYNIFIAYK